MEIPIRAISINLNENDRIAAIAKYISREPSKRVVVRQTPDVSRSLATARRLHQELLREPERASYIKSLVFDFHGSLYGSRFKFLDITLRRFDWYSTSLKKIRLTNYRPTRADLVLWKWTYFPNLQDWSLWPRDSKLILIDECIELCALMSEYSYKNIMVFNSFMKYYKYLIAFGKKTNIWKITFDWNDSKSMTLEELRIYCTLFARDTTKSSIKRRMRGYPGLLKLPKSYMVLQGLKENSIADDLQSPWCFIH